MQAGKHLKIYGLAEKLLMRDFTVRLDTKKSMAWILVHAFAAILSFPWSKN